MNEIIAKLKGVKRNGNQYTALCPAHDDQKPSLAVSAKDGKILLHCHAGCSKESVVAAMGLEMKDLFTEEILTPYTANDKPKWDIAAVYDYKNLAGEVVHSTIRLNPKGFRQRGPDPDRPGAHIWKDVFKSVSPILYNLRAVTKAVEEHRPILIVEGEKDCENLIKLGFTATTCPMGAGKWRDEYSDTLTGATVYIIADNDEVGKTHAKTVAESLAGKAEEINLIDLVSAREEKTDLPRGYDISDFIEAIHKDERKAAILDLITNSKAYVAENQTGGEKSGGLSGGGKPTPATKLMSLVEESGALFFHSDVKDLYAAMKVNNHTEIMSIGSRAFELWLIGLYYNACGQPISNDAIKRVLGACSAKAMYDSPNPVRLSVRVAEYGGEFWYDLTNNDWQVVKISKDGWRVENEPPILFDRFRHQSPQAMPKNGGGINKILVHVNLKDNKTLFLCWLVSCFVPNIPHSAIILHGEKGAAKSTASELLKNLIDPSSLETLTLQSNQRTLAVNLLNHWFLPFDNVSFISEEVSDTLCRAITGGGIQQRKLNTNSEDVIFTFQRCIAINGIQNAAKRADLLDRSILIELLRIKDENRKELTEITANFEADRPEILGGIFDTLSKAMAVYPAVKLRNLPRMADFARWGYAIGEALGGMGQRFLDEYAANRQIQNEEAIAGDPVATLIVEFMRDREYWSGKCSELYNKLLSIAYDHGISTSDKYYPKNAIVLAKKFSDIKSNLESIGLFVEKVMPRKEDGQHYSIKRGKSSTSSTALQKPSNNAGLTAVGNTVDAVESVGSTGDINTPTAREAPVYAETVDTVDDVDKNALFGDGWVEVSDEEIPPEFLKPAPLSPPKQERLKP